MKVPADAYRDEEMLDQVTGVLSVEPSSITAVTVDGSVGSVPTVVLTVTGSILAIVSSVTVTVATAWRLVPETVPYTVKLLSDAYSEDDMSAHVTETLSIEPSSNTAVTVEGNAGSVPTVVLTGTASMLTIE
jgi:hypothetical protein